MSARLPLVINDGQIEQLQPVDTLDIPVPSVDIISKTNGSGTLMIRGAPVFVKSDGNIDLAEGSDASTSTVFGLMVDQTSNGNSGNVQVDGILSLSTVNWDSVVFANPPGGLTPGTVYYLLATSPFLPGFLTATAPSTPGQTVIKVGIASNTTDMLIQIGPAILL